MTFCENTPFRTNTKFRDFRDILWITYGLVGVKESY